MRDKEIGKSVKREKLKRENERKREKIRREQKREKIGEKKQELTILCSLVKNWMKAIFNSMELLWNYNSNSFVLSKQKIWNFLNPIPQFFNFNVNSRFAKRGLKENKNIRDGNKKRISFFELFPIASKEYIVATFLAILEMAKSKELIIKQDNNFDDIICEVNKNE